MYTALLKFPHQTRLIAQNPLQPPVEPSPPVLQPSLLTVTFCVPPLEKWTLSMNMWLSWALNNIFTSFLFSLDVRHYGFNLR